MWSLLEYLRISFVQSLQYRSEMIVWVLLTVTNLLILILAWANIIDSTGDVSGFSYIGIVQYYFIVTLIDTLTSSHFEEWRSQEVRDGKIDTLLTKPVSYPLQIFLRDLGGKFFWVSISLPVLLVAIIPLVGSVSHQLVIPPLANLLSTIPLLLFAYWFQFCLALMIVFATFWLEGAEGLQHFKWIVISMFSGLMIPIPFMPGWMQKIVDLLPFKYLFAVPAGVIQGHLSLRLQDLTYMLIVLAIITFLTQFVWIRAKRHYASAGG